MPIADNLISQIDVNTRGRTDDAPYDHVRALLPTLTRGTPVVGAAGDGGHVPMTYDGASEEHVFSNVAGFSGGADFTIAVRFRTTVAASAAARVFGMGVSASQTRTELFVREPLGNDIAAVNRDDSLNTYSSFVNISPPPYTDGNEHILLMRHTVPNHETWWNGARVDGPTSQTFTGSFGYGADSYTLGGRLTGNWFAGDIFWAALWDRALTDAEITTELAAAPNPFLPTTSNQVLFDVDINTMIAGNLKFGTNSQLRAEFGAGAFRGLQFSGDFDA